MPLFTLPSGDEFNVHAKEIIRARPTLYRDIFERPTHIGTALFKPKLLVLEKIDVVGPALQEEHASYTRLTGIRNRSLWFNAKKASNAQPPRAAESGGGVNAIVPVGGIRMRVIETVEQAQSAIDTARNKPT